MLSPLFSTSPKFWKDIHVVCEILEMPWHIAHLDCQLHLDLNIRHILLHKHEIRVVPRPLSVEAKYKKIYNTVHSSAKWQLNDYFYQFQFNAK